MSRVYFHSPSADAELHGSERAWLRHVADGPARAAWDIDRTSELEAVERIMAMIPEVDPGAYGANYLHDDLRLAQAQERVNKRHFAGGPNAPSRSSVDFEPLRKVKQSLNLRLFGGAGETIVRVAGHDLNAADVNLNTAVAAGSDPVRLAAKIAGWCESHLWVDGPDRAWTADIIDEGLRVGLYRRGLWFADHPNGPKDKWSDQGWDQVLALLRSRDDEPVVLSYSITDQFPNREAAGWSDRESWDVLSHSEAWRHALDGLRLNSPWLQLTPESLGEQMFSAPVTVYDLLAPDRDERVAAAFAEAST
jgi:hypothetical protein